MKQKSKQQKPTNHLHHSSHDEAIVRLHRASGHLTKVTMMIESHKPCAQILQQLTAVISALAGCRILLLQDHLNTCLRSALKPGNERLMDEIETVIKRTMRGA